MNLSDIRRPMRYRRMLATAPELVERTVPRYTSYPTAPHFNSSVRADTYASWLKCLPKESSLSLYAHVPYCEALCLYCGCHTKAVRRRKPIDAYAERLVEEINLVAMHTECRRVAHLHWGGGTPSILGPEQLHRIIAQLDAHFDLTAIHEHAIELDPRHVTRPLVYALADAGVNRVSLGVQDFSAHVQRVIGRDQPFETVARAVALLREAAIDDFNIDLMYGLPGQSEADVRRTAILAHALKPRRLAVFGYAHVPWFKPHQRLFDESSLPDPLARLRQAAAAHETLTALGYFAVGFDHFAIPGDSLAVAARNGRLRRNFQGYTTDDADALIGFGASAIGRLPQGYVQNATDIGGYSRAVASKRFATVRGIAFSADDRVRGLIINELMCNLRCDLDRITEQYGHGASTFDAEIESLSPFTEDGLVRIDGRHIVVEEKGRPYVRLVAATFDAYLATSRVRHSPAV